MAYTILLLPVTIARFVEFSGRDVPFRATIFADFVFNLQGVVNVALLLATRRFVPDTAALPLFEKRKHVSMSSPEAYGITPFVLPPRDAGEAEKGDMSANGAHREDVAQEQQTSARNVEDHTAPSSAQRAGAPGLSRTNSTSSTSSTSSADSQTPFILHIR